MNNYLRLLPDILLSSGGTIVLIAGALRDDRRMSDFLRWLSLAFVAAASFALLMIKGEGPIAAAGWLNASSLNVVFAIVFLAIIGWTVVAGSLPDRGSGEWYSLLLFAGLGMITLARTASLAALFLGVEVLSLSLYVLIAFTYTRKLALRAGIMYLVLAGFASGFLVFGLALIYAVYGTLDVAAIEAAVTASPSMSATALIGFGLFIAGVAFKLSIVPFHMWASDVYEAAPGAVSGIIASASKGAVIAAFIPFLFLMKTHWQVIWAMAAASMIIGNFLGLRETRIKRILAYSSIAHVGYILVGFLAGRTNVAGANPAGSTLLANIDGVTAVVFYVVAYGVAITGAFVALSLIEREADVTLRDLRGVAKRNPAVAYSMLVFIVSLASLPPTVGFFGKIYLFSAAVNAGYLWLPLIGLVTSGIGIYYYLNIIVHLFMKPSDVSEIKMADSPFQNRVLLASAIVTVLIGLFPDAVLRFLQIQ